LWLIVCGDAAWAWQERTVVGCSLALYNERNAIDIRIFV